MQVITKQTEQFKLEFTKLEPLNYALYHCGAAPLSRLSLTNTSTRESPQVHLQVAIEGYSDTWEQRFEPLPPAGKIQLEKIDLNLHYTKLEGLETKIRTRLIITINGQVICCEAFNILGFYEWSLSSDPLTRISLAAFVQPAHPVIQHIVLEAHDYLQKQGTYTSFTHILTTEHRDKTDRVVKALYNLLHDRYDIRYVYPPSWSFEYSHQVIRPPQKIMPTTASSGTQGKKGAGTCIDLSLFLSACLESIHFQPLLVFVQTDEHNQHVLLGCWRSMKHRSTPIISDYKQLQVALKSGQLVLIDPTCLTDRWKYKENYETAVKKGLEQLDQDCFVFALDIQAARLTVTPLQFPMNPGVIALFRGAEHLAQTEKSMTLETKHLLFSFFLGSVEEDHTLAHVLERADIDLTKTRALVQAMIQRPADYFRTGDVGSPRPTANYRRVLEDAKIVASDAGEAFVDKAHVFYALLQSQSDCVKMILQKTGLDRKKLETQFKVAFSWVEGVIHTKFSKAQRSISFPSKPEKPLLLFKPRQTLLKIDALPLDIGLAAGYRENAPIPNTPFRVGDPIGDEWQILGCLGKGGMGVVYLAFDREENDLVALKTIQNELLTNQDARKYFRNEVHLWLKICEHPCSYILKAKKVRELDNRFYISMEYIPPVAQSSRQGITLRDQLDYQKKFDIEHVLALGMQFCQGMLHAYSYGLKSHGDIRPENIFITQDNILKISDFGIALSVGESGVAHGSSGHCVYIAPERFGETTADEVSDIYSFGMVLFEMVSGGPPFSVNELDFSLYNDWVAAWKYAHTYKTVPPVSPKLDPIIQKCLAKDRQNRYRYFRELMNDLADVALRLNIEITLEKPTRVQLSVPDLTTKGWNLLELGSYETAIPFFDRVLKREAENTTALNGKGFSFFGLSRIDEAEILFNQVLERSPEDMSGLTGKAMCLIRRNCFQQADHCLVTAMDNHPDIPALWYHRGNIFTQKGNHKKALKCYLQALELLIAQNRHEEAKTIINQAFANHMSNTRLRQLHAWLTRLISCDENDLLKSRTELEKLSLQPGSDLDSETKGLLAGTYKRLWKTDPITYIDLLFRAFELYYSDWEHSGKKNLYTGINAATLALLAGDRQKSQSIAQAVLEYYYQKRDLNDLPIVGTRFSSYWYRVIQAEAVLLLGHFDKARQLYGEMITLFHEKKAYIRSTLEQIDLILPRLDISLNALDFIDCESSRMQDSLKGNHSMYRPKPINTSQIKLSESVLDLSELLAENAHDNWAQQRMNEGWTYGDQRDDTCKKHPNLIPYCDLPPSEKEYDRKMTLETLKTILTLGYRIEIVE